MEMAKHNVVRVSSQIDLVISPSSSLECAHREISHFFSGFQTPELDGCEIRIDPESSIVRLSLSIRVPSIEQAYDVTDVIVQKMLSSLPHAMENLKAQSNLLTPA